jgi:hypothetical protein
MACSWGSWYPNLFFDSELHVVWHPPLRMFQLRLYRPPPEGDEEQDMQIVVRKERDLRPLNLKNTDNKTMTGAVNHCI